MGQGRSTRYMLAFVLAGMCGPATALQLTLPTNARATAARDSTLELVSIAVGPFADGALPTRQVEGAVLRRAYRLPSPGLTPLQILAPLRAQLDAAGYDILLDCDEDLCGGFDFRFAIDVLPAPNMYINIRAFHFLSAQHPETGGMVSLVASAAAGAGYLQIVQVGPQDAPDAPVTTANPAPASTPTTVATATPAPTVGETDLQTALLQSGAAVLHGIDFAVGTTTLSSPDAPELAALAELLQARPGLQIAVVGHTDTVGGLDANINVSRARARAVREALINAHGVPGGQIEAEGMGYLSPIATNLTAEGRAANRRVEVIVVRESE
ncbi:OmpA family protein [uncultured Tateyamaria sp.]|uniref:OmpA family protein n=2 Tax=uncultured Tateyamaria sp. TaxID=455651 RepID=UPI002626EC21|nr:OmpA family protein [uncultured Tateyamaria sp.]